MDPQSFPEFLSKMLENSKQAFRFLLVIGACLLLLMGVVCATMLFLQWRNILPDEAKVEGVELHFNTTTDKKRQYFFVVHPQGWQETPVRLNKGDRLEINAAGSIAIDMWGINTYSNQRDKIDKSVKKHAEDRGEWDKDRSAPEKYYSKKEYAEVMEDAIKDNPSPRAMAKSDGLNVVQNIKPLRGWTGPYGYADSPVIDTAYPGRSVERVSKDLRYGALLGTIAPQVSRECTTEMVLKFTPICIPKKEESVFAVTQFPQPSNPTSDGEERALWLIVNDVVDKDDPIFPEKFFVDNLGFFYVEVTVTPARQ